MVFPEEPSQDDIHDLGISLPALRLARIIDRLPVGDYTIDVDKNMDGWDVEIASLTTLRMVNLPRKSEE